MLESDITDYPKSTTSNQHNDRPSFLGDRNKVLYQKVLHFI